MADLVFIYNTTNHKLVAQCRVLPCLTDPSYSTVNNILTTTKAILRHYPACRKISVKS